MDAASLNENIRYLSDAGSVTLNVAERMQLELSLEQLKNAISFQHLYLWGKLNGKSFSRANWFSVTGQVCDYFVAVGMNCNGHSKFPERRFFWCTSETFTFGEMPAPKNNNKSIFE